MPTMSLNVVSFIARQEGGQLAPDGLLFSYLVSDSGLPAHRVVWSSTDGESETYPASLDSLLLQHGPCCSQLPHIL